MTGPRWSERPPTKAAFWRFNWLAHAQVIAAIEPVQAGKRAKTSIALRHVCAPGPVTILALLHR